MTRRKNVYLYFFDSNRVEFHKPNKYSEQNYTSFMVKYPNLYMGTDNGNVEMAVLGDSETFEEKSSYETKSNLPILHLLSSE